MKRVDFSALDAAAARMNPVLALIIFGLVLLYLIAFLALRPHVPQPASAETPRGYETKPKTTTLDEVLKDMANHD